MINFFISYTGVDKQWAEWIDWQLRAAGYSTIVQAYDFRPGSNFVLEMDNAIRTSERTIIVLSPEFLDAEYTYPEWAAAFKKDPRGTKGILLPVRVKECDPEGLLAAIIYIDLVNKDEAAAKEALLNGVQREPVRPTSSPRFPGGAAPPFPCTLPAIWNVPFTRNPNFTGRADLLKNLREALVSCKDAALTQALHGLGGVGKTQTAVEYCYRHKDDYQLVWWLRAEEPVALAADYAGLARYLFPDQVVADQAALVEAVRRWLETHGGWLLVFDNANEPRDLQPFRPRSASGHVLITSRNPNWGAVAQRLPVLELPTDEAVAFLLARTGQQDEAAARELAELVDGLPLALEQAAAYMEATNLALAEYIARFNIYPTELLKLGELHNYPHSVATTFEVSLLEVQRQLPAATEFLSLLAFFGPDDLPLHIVRDGVKHLTPHGTTLTNRLLKSVRGLFRGTTTNSTLENIVKDPLKMDATEAALRRYSLVESGSDSLSMHRIVQAIIRDRLDDAERRRWVEAAVRVVNDAFPYDVADVRTWQTCTQLLPHALA